MNRPCVRIGTLARRTERRHRMGRAGERAVIWNARMFRDLHYWIRTDPQIALSVMNLMKEITHGPSHPETLRHRDGRLARPLTGKHRLVYRVLPGAIHFLQARIRLRPEVRDTPG